MTSSVGVRLLCMKTDRNHAVIREPEIGTGIDMGGIGTEKGTTGEEMTEMIGTPGDSCKIEGNGVQSSVLVARALGIMLVLAIAVRSSSLRAAV